MLDWIKEHPYLTGGLVLLVIVFFVLRSSSSSSSSGTSADGTVTVGPDDSTQQMALQANTALQTASYQAQTTVAGYNAQIAATQLTTASDVVQASFARDVDLQQIISGQDVANNQTEAQRQIGLAQVGGQVSIAAIGAGLNPFSYAVAGQQQAQQASAAYGSQAQAAINTVSGVTQTVPTPSVPGSPGGVSPSGYQDFNDFENAVRNSYGAQPQSNGTYVVDTPQSIAANQAALNAWISNPTSPHFPANATPETIAALTPTG